MKGADEKQSRQFSLRTGGGLERNGVHAGDFEKTFFKQAQDFQAALRELLRLIRMFGGDAIEAGDKFVDTRIVFHGAGAKRIHAEIDGVVPSGEPREVADDFDLADFGEAFDTVAAMAGAQSLCRISGRNVERRQLEGALAGRGFFEDQAFVLITCGAWLF